MNRSDETCCAAFVSAIETTFANYLDDTTGWFLFGTDHESTVAGSPEIAYWAIHFCPFCGAELRRPDTVVPRGPPKTSD